MIAIINLGVGNLGSILNMLRRVGAEAVVSDDPGVIAAANKLVLPGVGSFDKAAERLGALGLRPVLEKRVVEDGTPILGICLGMQLLTRGSEEGQATGLGWIPGVARRFKFSRPSALKIPHMGWNTVYVTGALVLFDGLGPEPRFYFAHSYHVVCDEAAHAAATCHYGYDFTCAVARGNVAGVQFHPEKSHRFGLRLLRNFAERF